MWRFLALVSYVCGAACFVRFFLLAPRLAPERIAPPSRREFWTAWLPGEFTPAGQRLRLRMTRLFLVGWILLMLGIWLSHHAAVRRIASGAVISAPSSGDDDRYPGFAEVRPC
jgi:hypothetical protein